MTPKDLAQSLKTNLERESALDVQDVSVSIQYCEKLAKATVAKFVDGKWQLFEVLVRPIGYSDQIEIGA